MTRPLYKLAINLILAFAFSLYVQAQNSTYLLHKVGVANTEALAVTVNRAPFDFDGDGKTDISVFRPTPAPSTWYVIKSSDGSNLFVPYGLNGDQLAPGDYDGDGKTDFAIYRPSNATFYILQSSNNALSAQPWGYSTDKLVPADYDGDGKADVAVWRPSDGTFHILQSSNNNYRGQQWGTSGDLPVPGDYDGDGKVDCAVVRPSENIWYVLKSSDGAMLAPHWGTSGDIPVPGDYDGDGKTDVAVFRPSDSTFYILQSSNGSLRGQQWGIGTDQPVPGDYDGDDKTDIALWHPETGIWSILRSSDGGTVSQQWGAQSDLPVPASYVYGGSSSGMTSGALTGTISRTSDGLPLSGAIVEALQTGTVRASATTGSNGNYSITGLTAGTYDIRISSTGYITALRAGIVVSAGETVTVNEALSCVYSPGPPPSDNFNDNALNPTLWSLYSSSHANRTTVAEQNQQIEILFAAQPDYNGISGQAVNLTDSYAQIQFISQSADPTTDTYFYVRTGNTDNDAIVFQIYNGNINCYQQVGFAAQGVISSFTYNSTQHKFFRLRHSSSAAMIYWEVSADSQSWTTLKSAALIIPITAVRPTLLSGSVGVNNKTVFDNFKFGPNSASTNVPPALNVTAPINNAAIVVGSAITLSVNANDEDGTISKVEFFQGATKLGEDTTAPYSFTWGDAPSGDYQISAKATDNMGATSSSEVVSVTVYPEIPTLNDEFNVVGTPDSKWTRANWSGSLASSDVNTTKPGALWTRNNFGSDLHHALLQPLPAGDFSSITKIRISGTAANFNNLGIIVTDSATGNSGTQFTAMLGYNSGWIVGGVQYSNYQTYSSTPTSIIPVRSPVSQDVWVRMRRSGITYYVGFSYNGSTWFECAGTSLSFTPTQIGIVTDNNAPDTQLDAWFDFFRFTHLGTPPSVPLSDDFNDNRLNPLRWVAETSSGTIAETNQRLEISSNQATPGVNWVSSINTFDLTGKSVQVEVVNGPNNQGFGNPDTQMLITPDMDMGRAIFFSLYADANGATIRFFQNGDYTAITYNATNHRFWRLRHDPANNRIIFETSPDGSAQSWTLRRWVTPSFPITALHLLLKHGTGATGANQSTAIFDSVQLTPDNPNNLPTVNLASPTSSATFNVGSSITLDATATDSDGAVSRVEFFQGTTKLGEDTTAPYSFTWTGMAAGDYTLTARASDNVDGASISSAVNITVRSLLAGKVTKSDGTTPVAGATVKVYQGATVVATAVTNDEGDYSIPGLSFGTYTVEALSAGYVSKIKTGVTITAASVATANLSLDASNSAAINYSYDELGRLIGVVDPAGDSVTYNYDAVGNLQSISRQSATQTGIIKFSPGSGPVGTSVVINGTGFSSTPGQNTVTFNGVSATVSSASATQIITSVPVGATTGPVGITTPSGSASSNASFQVTTGSSGAPTISGFTPTVGTAGQTVTISGTGFETSTVTDNKVKFNGNGAGIGAVTGTSITTSVPSVPGAGRISITTPSGTAVSLGDFFIPPSMFTLTTPAEIFTANDLEFTGRMAVNETKAVTITTPGKLGMIAFDGIAGQQVRLSLTGISFTSGSRMFVAIYNPDGTYLINPTVVDSYPGAYSFNVQALPATSTYTIFINPYDDNYDQGTAASMTLHLDLVQ